VTIRQLHERVQVAADPSAASWTDAFTALEDAGLIDEARERLAREGVDTATLQPLSRPRPSASPPAVTDSTGIALHPPSPLHATAAAATAAGSPTHGMEGPAAEPAFDPSRSTLRVRFTGGRAFLAHLDEKYIVGGGDDGDDDDVDDLGRDSDVDAGSVLLRRATAGRRYVLFATGPGVRFQSAPVPVAIEPRFGGDAGFSMDLSALAGGGWDDSAHGPPPHTVLLRIGDAPIHVALAVLTLHGSASPHGQAPSSTAADATLDLVGCGTLEWRSVLAAADGHVDVICSLQPAGPGPHAVTPEGAPIPVGLLHAALDVYPRPDNVDAVVTGVEVNAALRRTVAGAEEATRAFFAYARAWWSEYRAVHPSFHRRYVKLFGEDASGVFQPVSTYVTPMPVGE